MKHLIVRYKVKEDKVPEIIEAIGNFVEAIIEREPDTLLYNAYQEPDGVSFVHFMTFRDEGAEEFHKKTGHVKKFTDVLYPNCTEEPVFTEIKEIATTQ